MTHRSRHEFTTTVDPFDQNHTWAKGPLSRAGQCLCQRTLWRCRNCHLLKLAVEPEGSRFPAFRLMPPSRFHKRVAMAFCDLCGQTETVKNNAGLAKPTPGQPTTTNPGSSAETGAARLCLTRWCGYHDGRRAAGKPRGLG